MSPDNIPQITSLAENRAEIKPSDDREPVNYLPRLIKFSFLNN